MASFLKKIRLGISFTEQNLKLEKLFSVRDFHHCGTDQKIKSRKRMRRERRAAV